MARSFQIIRAKTPSETRCNYIEANIKSPKHSKAIIGGRNDQHGLNLTYKKILILGQGTIIDMVMGWGSY